MLFKIFLPYQDYTSENESVEGYYNSPQDYIDALRANEISSSSFIMSTIGGNNANNFTYYAEESDNQSKDKQIEAKIAYAQADCTLFSPNGAIAETVDSIIDKFVSQKEFLVTVNLNESSMEPEFEEELANWNNETSKIKEYAKKLGDEWLEKNIPRRQMRLSFKNKSDKTVSFILENAEIEEKISRKTYLIYVNKMQILK